jgi:hypothetical protein
MLPTPIITIADAAMNLTKNLESTDVQTVKGNMKRNLLPTPRQSEWKGVGRIGSKSYEHMKNKDYLCAIAQEQTGQSGQLNPRFVAEMMGFPPDWTELPFQSGETKA